MQTVTHYNEFGTKSQRVVATYKTDLDGRSAMNEAVKAATAWNSDERRPRMQVKFVLVGSEMRAL